jgi:hypothetical protein
MKPILAASLECYILFIISFINENLFWWISVSVLIDNAEKLRFYSILMACFSLSWEHVNPKSTHIWSVRHQNMTGPLPETVQMKCS